MIALFRHVLLLSVVAVASWWLFLYAPDRAPERANEQPIPLPLSIALTPMFDARPEEASFAAPVPKPIDPPEARAEVPPSPPPPELGDPEGDPLAELEGSDEPTTSEAEAEAEAEETETEVDDVVEESDDGANASATDLMSAPHLLDAARAELSGETRRGFATVLLASPEDQIEIARFFDEELVVVPKNALDPDTPKPIWFRLDHGDAPVVESVKTRPTLESYRQYRDLFDYEYARLPAPLRELRRSVLSRTEIYIFAALIPLREWAVVVGRRDEALAEAGRTADEVKRFVLRYVRRSEGFDLQVEEIVFADGRRFVPSESTKGG